MEGQQRQQQECEDEMMVMRVQWWEHGNGRATM